LKSDGSNPLAVLPRPIIGARPGEQRPAEPRSESTRSCQCQRQRHCHSHLPPESEGGSGSVQGAGSLLSESRNAARGPGVEPEWELGSSLRAVTPVDWTATQAGSELAGQSVPADRGLPVGSTGRSRLLGPWPRPGDSSQALAGGGLLPADTAGRRPGRSQLSCSIRTIGA
jgi:hypothetical protein